MIEPGVEDMVTLYTRTSEIEGYWMGETVRLELSEDSPDSTLYIDYDGGGKRQHEYWEIIRHRLPKGRERFTARFNGGGGIYSRMISNFDIETFPVELSLANSREMAATLIDRFNRSKQTPSSAA